MMNKFGNLPGYGNFDPILLNVHVILNIFLTVVKKKLSDCKMQMLGALLLALCETGIFTF